MKFEPFSENGIRIPRLGITLTFGLIDDDRGQPFVQINTEDAPAKYTYGDDNGMPIITVGLNDATLYDDEGEGMTEASVNEALRRIGKEDKRSTADLAAVINEARPESGKNFTVVGVYANEMQRFATSVEALDAAEAERMVLEGKTEIETEGGDEVIIAGVIEGDHEMVA